MQRHVLRVSCGSQLLAAAQEYSHPWNDDGGKASWNATRSACCIVRPVFWPRPRPARKTSTRQLPQAGGGAPPGSESNPLQIRQGGCRGLKELRRSECFGRCGRCGHVYGVAVPRGLRLGLERKRRASVQLPIVGCSPRLKKRISVWKARRQVPPCRPGVPTAAPTIRPGNALGIVGKLAFCSRQRCRTLAAPLVAFRSRMLHRIWEEHGPGDLWTLNLSECLNVLRSAASTFRPWPRCHGAWPVPNRFCHPGRRKALLIGVNYFGTRAELSPACNLHAAVSRVQKWVKTE